MRIFRTKSIDQLLIEAGDKEHGLKRVLSGTSLVTLGIGAIIGTGIFVLTGTVAANYAGPALVLSFMISAIGCVFAGLCYAEFASMIPISGSAYTYSYATLGEFIAWIIGWDLILEYLFASSTVAVGWSGYMVSFLHDYGLNIPTQLCNAPIDYIKGQGWILTGSIVNFPAIFIIALLSTLLVIGIRESAGLNNIIVAIKVVVILLFIGFGLSYIDTSNWTPFIPPNPTGDFGNFGFSGVLRGAAVIFFAYIGFDAVSTAAQEAKNPQRDMPIGILGSLLVCTILYVLVSGVLTGIVHYSELNVPAPLAMAIDKTGDALLWLRPLIKIGAIAGLSSVILVMLLGQPRIFFTMSNDGLLPKSFSKVHPKFRTPYITTIITGVIASIIAGVLPIHILSELVSIGTLLAFTIVCISIIILRAKKPDVPRPFKTPLVPYVPIAGAAICLMQMFSLPWETWERLIIWMIIGLFIYFLYGIRKSKLADK
jgi:basic amino acid/polyamine antiporter, APA family